MFFGSHYQFAKFMENNGIKIVGLIVAAIVVIFLFFTLLPFTIIGAGERGVVFNNFSGIENRILGEGIHFRMPLVESVIKMPIQTQAANFKENAGSSDSQSIEVDVTVNWHLDPSRVNRVYQTVGDIDAVVARVLTNNSQDAVKASVSKYAALEFQKNRENVRSSAQDLLQAKVKKYNVIIDNLSFTNINFSAEFNAAVEQAQVAQQKAKQAEYDVQRVTNEAQAAIAKAKGEAEAQKQVQQSLTPELLQKLFIERWNGVLPSYMGVGTALPFLDLNK